MSYNPNTKEMITTIAQALGELNENAVFVGGATVPFYLPDAYQSAARPTEDVDVVLEIIILKIKKLRRRYEQKNSTMIPARMHLFVGGFTATLK